jgi:hypothetical protein
MNYKKIKFIKNYNTFVIFEVNYFFNKSKFLLDMREKFRIIIFVIKFPTNIIYLSKILYRKNLFLIFLLESFYQKFTLALDEQ